MGGSDDVIGGWILGIQNADRREAKISALESALHDTEQALAKKDREIQQIREHEFQNGYREGEAAAKDALAEKDRVIAGLSGKVKNLTKWSDIMFGTPCEEIRHAQQMEELEEKYKKLLGQAVRFAEAYRNAHLSSWLDLVIEELAEEMATKDPVYVEAQAFLKEHS